MKNVHYLKPKLEPRAARVYRYRPPPANHPLLLTAPMAPRAAAATPLPPSVDLRNLCLPIRDQGQEGACSGFATAAFREVYYAVTTQTQLPGWLSPAYLYARGRMDDGTFPTDSGTSVADEFAVLQNRGVCPEAFMPFDQNPSEAPTGAADAAAVPFRLVQPIRIDPPGNVTALKTALANKQTVAIGFYVYESFEHPDANGVVPIPDTSQERLINGHCVLVCGYDDGKSYWIIRNQYGEVWGAGGYCFMPYGYERLWLEAWTAA